jgi:Fe-Mn family superoxide dismutase
LNHTLFWENLTPTETTPGPETTKAIAAAFGDIEAMKAEMSAKSVAVQGSGWGWLGYNKATGRVEVATCANQDPLEATTGLVPLLGIDVWEHAYVVYFNDNFLLCACFYTRE